MSKDDLEEFNLYLKATRETISDLRKKVEALEERLNKEESK